MVLLRQVEAKICARRSEMVIHEGWIHVKWTCRDTCVHAMGGPPGPLASIEELANGTPPTNLPRPEGGGAPGLAPPLTTFQSVSMRPIKEQEVIRIPDLPTPRNKQNRLYGLKVLVVTASGWRSDRHVSLWIDAAVDMRRNWDDRIDSGHEDLVTLDLKLADALMQFFWHDNKLDSAQRLYLKKQDQIRLVCSLEAARC